MQNANRNSWRSCAMTTNNRPNRLSKEKSPYLLQHAYQPVNWFPWGEEAFEKARKEDKPVFLSIGYSTCHWCHVMAQESFEDDEVAGWLNDHYIAIKVDREERPDVDQLYMSACQAMTGQGGWPLTVLMTQDQKPFYAGTYFARDSQNGQPGILDIISQVHQKWSEDRTEILDIGDEIAEMVRQRANAASGGKEELSEETLHMAFELLGQAFDEEYGGFGDAPKFPNAPALLFLLRYYQRTGRQEALDMVEKTLASMHQGGLFDHIGYGFFRCSRDERWLAPYFEKMLYDNALLAFVYIEAFQVTDEQAYAEIAGKIFTYVLRDMVSEEGAFYSAEAPGSEDAEEFYMWTPEEIIDVLGEEDGELFCDVFDIQEDGFFEETSLPNLLGVSRAAFAQLQQIDPVELEKRIETSRLKLFKHRLERMTPPLKDDKSLTAWNGLMIAALAKGAQVLQRQEYAEAASKAVKLVMDKLVRQDGRLLARYRDQEAGILGYLDDYAFLVWGLLELYEATQESEYLQQAVDFTEEMLRLFRDEENGGFYFSGCDGEELLARPKEILDGAMPSGNSVAALNLLRLASLTGEEKLLQLAQGHLKSFAEAVEQYPAGFPMYLTALDHALSPKK